MLRTRYFKNNVARRPPLHRLRLPLLISIAAADTGKVQASPAASTKALQAYHDRLFSRSLTKVSVSKDKVWIEGHMGIILNEPFLADIPVDLLVGDPHSWQTLVPARSGSDGHFKINVPRHRLRDGLDYDRLTSRWQLVCKTDTGFEPLSKARYAEWMTSLSPQLPAAKPANNKGLGGWHFGLLPDELDELGISAVTVNAVAAPYLKTIGIKSSDGVILREAVR